MKKQIAVLWAACVALCAQAQPLLVGMTNSDGANRTGTIIRYTGGDTLSGQFNLPANPKGSGPQSINLTQAPNRYLYGLSTYDGASGYGTVFEYDYDANTYTVKAAFDSSTTGYAPYGSLLLAAGGLMYGLASAGDTTGGGTLFSYRPGSSSITRLVTLPAGAGPQGSLIQASNGHLYGMTDGDGANSSGTIFQYDTLRHIYTVLYDLPTNAYPDAGAMVEAGADTLYGLTYADGSNFSGTLFRFIISTLSYDVLVNLPANANPSNNLMRATDGQLYGMTNGDGANSFGTIFSYDISSGTYTDKYDFGNSGLHDGLLPYGGLMQASDSMLYGMTNLGGVNGSGTIFQYNITTGSYSKKTDLSSATGDYPYYGHLTEYQLPRIAPPAIDTQPANAVACPGNTATFSVSTGGTATSFQWQSDYTGAIFINIPGATDSTYSFIVQAGENAYRYRAVLTDAGGSDTTESAALIVISLSDSATVSGPVCSVPGNGASYQWITCTGQQPIAGAVFSSYTATANGSYRCILTIAQCTDTTDCVTVTDAGIADVSSYHFSLYPDPTPGMFTVSGDYTGTLTVLVVSLWGEQLREFSMTGPQKLFDISDLAAGIYQVQISDGTHTLRVLKVVKE